MANVILIFNNRLLVRIQDVPDEEADPARILERAERSGFLSGLEEEAGASRENLLRGLAVVREDGAAWTVHWEEVSGERPGSTSRRRSRPREISRPSAPLWSGRRMGNGSVPAGGFACSGKSPEGRSVAGMNPPRRTARRRKPDPMGEGRGRKALSLPRFFFCPRKVCKS